MRIKELTHFYMNFKPIIADLLSFLQVGLDDNNPIVIMDTNLSVNKLIAHTSTSTVKYIV